MSVRFRHAPFFSKPKVRQYLEKTKFMDNLNVSEVVNNEDVNSKESAKRSSWVSRPHSAIVEFVANIYKNLGSYDYHSNKAIAAANSLSPDSIKPQLSTAQQFKLLEIKHGVGYKITDLFVKIYLPENEAEKRSAVIESLKSPDTYQPLFKQYEFHVLPPVSGLKNYFVRNYQFKEAVAEKTAEYFVENLNEYELLDARGVLISGMPMKPIRPDIKTDTEEQPPKRESETDNGGRALAEIPDRPRIDKLIFQSELDTQGKKTVPIYLVGSKQALFIYPDDITEDEIELVKHQIEGVLMRIKLESKSKNKPTE